MISTSVLITVSPVRSSGTRPLGSLAGPWAGALVSTTYLINTLAADVYGLGPKK